MIESPEPKIATAADELPAENLRVPSVVAVESLGHVCLEGGHQIGGLVEPGDDARLNEAGEWRYWTMGEPLEKCVILNRENIDRTGIRWADKEDDFGHQGMLFE